MLTRNAWLGSTLLTLVNAELAPYESIGIQKWNIVGDDVDLDSRRAVAFSMVLHELTTNAMKYGALSVNTGHIQISWRMVTVGGISRLHMTWAESGGPVVPTPTRIGVGRRLLTRALAAELNGLVELIFESSGLRCEIDVPLEPVRHPAP
jgi:two-component sensor histidine kinase